MSASAPIDNTKYGAYELRGLYQKYAVRALIFAAIFHFVGIGRVPAPIDDAEMAAIQCAVRSGLRVEPSAYLDVGQRVRLEEGPLAGLEGILTEIRKHYRVVVSLSLLKRSVAVEIEHHWVTPLDAKPIHPYLRALTA